MGSVRNIHVRETSIGCIPHRPTEVEDRICNGVMCPRPRIKPSVFRVGQGKILFTFKREHLDAFSF